MPQILAGPIFAFLISSTAIATTLAGPLATFLSYAAFAGLAYLGQSLFVQKPPVPRPEDGSYNLKQNVPSRPYVYGRVKKGGDYLFLEQKNGTAYHIICQCSRRIGGYVQHYLHDEKVTLDGSGNVTAPSHFGTGNVNILTRLGLDAGTAYADIVSLFPTIWTNNHRGDGLATIRMSCKTVSSAVYLSVYPNQMPEHTAVIDGMLLYDPRKDSTNGGSGSHRWTNPNSWEFSRNLALMRLDHLCHPFGGKMSYADMNLAEWATAADVCDEIVVNRAGGNVRRYWGGFWFRANNDPIEVGKTIDEAGELVVYERSDGKIGVHPGRFVTPDIRLSEDDIFGIKVDKNRRRAATVLAVRGRYQNAANDYNTEDAAIYGTPYGVTDDSTERTKTFENSAIQDHNHCQRKQKLTFIRANARRVQITADYNTAKGCAFRRFVRVHYPSRGLVEAVIEITSTVTIDLRNMRVSFSGILVPSTLYDFNAATEEGLPGETITVIDNDVVPEPENFTPEIRTEVVTGGSTAAFIYATWDHVSDDLIYEMEYDRTSGSTGVLSVFSEAGADTIRSGYLVDGEEYQIRARAYGGATPSEWTDYVLLTATADPVAPGPVTSVSVDVATPGEAGFQWTAPNSANYFACRIFINTVNDLGTATLVATEYGPPSAVDLRTVASLPADDYYAWLISINPSGVAGTAVATGMFTVT